VTALWTKARIAAIRNKTIAEIIQVLPANEAIPIIPPIAEKYNTTKLMTIH
jgi:hypothetical protein